jgi:steroid 5-alpha reductase family enzyme
MDALINATLSIVADPLHASLVEDADVLRRALLRASTIDAPTSTITALGLAILFSQLAGSVTGWWSWVDRLWSIVPAVYVALVAAHAPSPRLLLMAGLSGVWALRLTLNFARKGGFGRVAADTEDYRWPVVRGWFARIPSPAASRVALELFHTGFVCVYQHILLWLLVTPSALLAARGSAPLGATDAALASLFAVLLGLETWADETQWAFQARKHAMTPSERARAGGDFARGFVTSGPFRYSRHLNFFAEQCLWLVFAGFPLAAGAVPSFASGALLGPLLLVALFQGSTWITENITIGKYPLYEEYQKTTSRLVPWLPGPRLDDGAAAAKAQKRAASVKRA